MIDQASDLPEPEKSKSSKTADIRTTDFRDTNVPSLSLECSLERGALFAAYGDSTNSSMHYLQALDIALMQYQQQHIEPAVKEALLISAENCQTMNTEMAQAVILRANSNDPHEASRIFFAQALGSETTQLTKRLESDPRLELVRLFCHIDDYDAFSATLMTRCLLAKNACTDPKLSRLSALHLCRIILNLAYECESHFKPIPALDNLKMGLDLADTYCGENSPWSQRFKSELGKALKYFYDSPTHPHYQHGIALLKECANGIESPQQQGAALFIEALLGVADSQQTIGKLSAANISLNRIKSVLLLSEDLPAASIEKYYLVAMNQIIMKSAEFKEREIGENTFTIPVASCEADMIALLESCRDLRSRNPEYAEHSLHYEKIDMQLLQLHLASSHAESAMSLSEEILNKTEGAGSPFSEYILETLLIRAKACLMEQCYSAASTALLSASDHIDALYPGYYGIERRLELNLDLVRSTRHFDANVTSKILQKLVAAGLLDNSPRAHGQIGDQAPHLLQTMFGFLAAAETNLLIGRPADAQQWLHTIEETYTLLDDLLTQIEIDDDTGQLETTIEIIKLESIILQLQHRAITEPDKLSESSSLFQDLEVQAEYCEELSVLDRRLASEITFLRGSRALARGEFELALTGFNSLLQVAHPERVLAPTIRGKTNLSIARTFLEKRKEYTTDRSLALAGRFLNESMQIVEKLPAETALHAQIYKTAGEYHRLLGEFNRSVQYDNLATNIETSLAKAPRLLPKKSIG